ncbi:hypothetical protein O3M35_007993 [Rhynocoris fuscipes]|uniref:Transient receptor ion channel domain-containing protein n=1 Tax=Rhynocoris fuscipes TaxID=488301 RepID=A0AAW1DIN5_9HEMI
MAGLDRTNKGRKLTGIPEGGFNEKVTKRWQFAEETKTKEPRPFLKRQPPVQQHLQRTNTEPELRISAEDNVKVTQQEEPNLPIKSAKLAPTLTAKPAATTILYQTEKAPSLFAGSRRSSPPYSYKEEFQQPLRRSLPEYIGTLKSARLDDARKTAQPRVSPVPAGIFTSGDSSIHSMKRPSVVLPTLMDDEKYFHDLVKSSDIAAVVSFLDQRPEFNINCTNFQGITALQIAVKSGNVELVSTLLEHPMIEIGDCALHAIKMNNLEILKVILEKQRSLSPNLEYLTCPNSAEFADNITPLILAAENNNYEIVGFLLDRGHIIPRPHKPRCFCKSECLPLLQTQDPLSISSGKLQIYRAISSPAYLCHSTDDPILAAFKLSKELKVAGNVDVLYWKEYYELADRTRVFAADIIGECRNIEEVEVILSLVPSTTGKLLNLYTFPRLVLAMDYSQKEFVARPNVQQV